MSHAFIGQALAQMVAGWVGGRGLHKNSRQSSPNHLLREATVTLKKSKERNRKTSSRDAI